MSAHRSLSCLRYLQRLAADYGCGLFNYAVRAKPGETTPAVALLCDGHKFLHTRPHVFDTRDVSTQVFSIFDPVKVD